MPDFPEYLLPDSHTHSHHSFDGSASVLALCEGARRNGMGFLTVTDHYECNCFAEDELVETLKKSARETADSAKNVQGTPSILFGMELGQPLQAPKTAERLLSEENYDFILGSLHNVQGFPDFYDMDYSAYDIKALFDRYFSELLEMVRWGNFDSLAHLTYPLRYLPKKGTQAERAYFESGQDTVLEALVQAGKALEINTSGLRQPLRETLPGADAVRRFRELGGELVTLGSDAHAAEDAGAGIKAGAHVAAAAGFTHVAVFRNRKPELLPIL